MVNVLCWMFLIFARINYKAGFVRSLFLILDDFEPRCSYDKEKSIFDQLLVYELLMQCYFPPVLYNVSCLRRALK